MEVKISIIVPVFNLEQLLPKCVESILSQTFTEFELILVNDGSTDKSRLICDKYAKLDKRVVVIHKENGGVASARNAGLAVAKGKYIGFVDNDDFINESMFEVLYTNANKYSADIVICDFLKVNEKQCIDIKWSDAEYTLLHYTNIQALNQIYTDNNLTFICPWNKLYKKSLFNDIKYELGNISDDETVAHKLLYESKKITYINSDLYYYVQREGSQINSPFHIKRLGGVYALKDRVSFFKSKNEIELHQKALKHYMDKFFWNYYLAKSKLTNVDKELKELKRTFDKNLFDLMKHKEISWKQKIMCVLFSASPKVFEFVKDFKINIQEKSNPNL